MTLRTQISETVVDNHNDSGEWLKWMPDERFLVRTSSSDADGRYTTLEVVADGSGPPLHIHHNEDEHFIILEGSVHFVRGDEVFDVAAGETVSIPRGVEHTWAITSKHPARFLITFAPGGFEEAFMAVVSVPKSELEATLARYGCTVEGPPLAV